MGLFSPNYSVKSIHCQNNYVSKFANCRVEWSGVFDKDISMMKVVTFCTRLCKHYLQVICHTNLGYLASMFMYNGYTCSRMKSSRGLLLYLLNIIASQLNPSREDLVFFLITYSTESHTTAHLFFFNNWYFRHDCTLVYKGTHSFLVSYFFNGVFACFVRWRENDILKKLDWFYLHTCIPANSHALCVSLTPGD